MLIQILIVSLVLVFIDIPYYYLNVTDIKQMYHNIQGHETSLKLLPSLIMYILMGSSIYYLCLKNDLQLNNKILLSAILGFSIYSIHHFNNLSILEKWEYKQALLDTLWGTTLFSVTTILSETIFKLDFLPL